MSMTHVDSMFFRYILAQGRAWWEMLCSSNLARAGGSLFEMAYDVLEELRDEGFQVLEAQVAVLEAQAAAKIGS